MLSQSSTGSNEEGHGTDLGALMGTCPLPLSDYQDIVLAHGSGGKLSQQLIQEILLPQFRNEWLDVQHDGAVLSLNGTRLAFSTDSYVVSPIFFPGGDIGKLAVHGTVNDLAMCGARPLYLSAGFILEEGLSMRDLWKVVLSMREAAGNGRCGLGDWRYQSGGPREGRQNLHQYLRDRSRAGRSERSSRTRPTRR